MQIWSPGALLSLAFLVHFATILNLPVMVDYSTVYYSKITKQRFSYMSGDITEKGQDRRHWGAMFE
jgi:hypothetical protein